MQHTSAAVVGAGTMGRGIATLLEAAGLTVRIFDVRPPPPQTLGPRITCCASLAKCVEDADVIFEAIIEDLGTKLDVIREVQRLVGATPIASNTSTFRPSDLVSGVEHPESVLVAHFFNPADVIPLVELVRGPETSHAAVELVAELLRGAGKLVVPLESEVPGFVANRLQAALIREAVHLLREGVASVSDIDQVVTGCLGPRWSVAGPFEVMDRGGLDVWQAVTGQLFPLLSTEASTPMEISSRVSRGDLGTKSGGGFYSYERDRDTEFIDGLRRVLMAARRR